MAKVFEDFVTKTLGAALETVAGRFVPQRRVDLDEHGLVPMKPDLTWLVDGQPVAVIDAKYKAEKPAGFPNADWYQLLAYCTALGLRAGHLIYAKGNEAATSARIRNTDIELVAHTLDLTLRPADLLAWVRRLAAAIESHTAERPSPQAANAREQLGGVASP